MNIQVAIAPGDRVVPWVSQCPPEWPLEPLKYAAKINTRTLGENTASDFEINYIDISSVDSNGRQNTAETMTFGDAPSRARRIVASGDTVISTVRTYLKAISYIENADDNLICSTGFAVVTPGPKLYPKFLYYWVCSEWFVNEIVARSVGVSYPAINAVEVGNLPCPAIPIQEQQAIVEFLDRETSRIDELVAKKQRLIDLLQEQRTALITCAVTNGLDSDATMKDSGVKWLGEIPAHWDINRFKWGVSLINDKVENGDAHTMYLGLENIESWTGRIVDSDFRPEQEGASNSFREDDVLFGKLRPYLAKAVHAQYHGTCTSELMVLRPKKYYSRYLFYYMLSSSTVNIIDSSTYGVKMPRANWQFIGDLPTTLPPLQEQQAIAEFLDKETSRIDNLVGRISQAIEKLQEYCSAVITAAVTGKIDVRDHVT